MFSRKEILSKLTHLKKELRNKYKVKELGLFGSYANEKQTNTSDIDILVDFEDGASLFDFVGVSLFLEEEFKCKVDLVSKNAVREEIKDYILSTVIYL